MNVLLFIIGLLVMIAGAELLVKGASRIAAALKISPLAIGLTVVAFGTSSPELAVGIESSLSGQQGITFGNVAGSNIFNVLFILGLSALILPLTVSAKLLRKDVPFMILLSILVYLYSFNGIMSRLEGASLVIGLIAYTYVLITQSRKEWTKPPGDDQRPSAGSGFWLMNGGMTIGGLALLMVGAQWFLTGAVTIAQLMGVSEMVIGLTIVAAGTSMPEVVTSILAAVRGEREIAVGNVIGSNIFNILGVLGISSFITSGGLEIAASFIRFDIPIMIASAFACLPIFFTGGIISRSEAALLFGYYLAYTAYLVLASSQHASLGAFSSAMIWFFIPLTLLGLLFAVVQQLKNIRSR